MYAVVDVETTGNHRGGDRIIEIAIIITDGEKIIREYQTLVNPQKSINPYVEKLTGIYEAMVKTAPTFSEVADEVFSLLEGHVFVAHNVSFDYTLVEGELNRAGIAFNASQIDTIAYARRVFQGLQSYSLGNVCDSLEIPHLDRHRAYGDTLATTHLLHLLLQKDLDGSSLKAMLQQGLDENCLPPLLSKEAILSLPATTGLVSFRTQEGLLFAIEATKNMRKKAIDKLQMWFCDVKDKALFESIATVEFIATGNELIAKIMKEETIANERPLVGRLSYLDPLHTP
jgi:DNA polymerase-3 subunit epsilon